VTWEHAVIPPAVVVHVDHPPKLPPLVINVTSSDPAIIPPMVVAIGASATSGMAYLAVVPQDVSFTSKLVTLTASYAGRTLTTNVRVVSPDAKGLPELKIDVDRSADPCRPLFVEGAEHTFEVTNLYVFADQTPLAFAWAVRGAATGALNMPSLTIPALPQAPTKVSVSVTVTNAAGLQARGTLTFQTVAVDWKVIDNELRCRLARLKNLHLSIPEWTHIEGDGRQRRLKMVDEQVRSVSREAGRVASVIRSVEERR
jgi:hypothetical protein